MVPGGGGAAVPSHPILGQGMKADGAADITELGQQSAITAIIKPILQNLSSCLCKQITTG